MLLTVWVLSSYEPLYYLDCNGRLRVIDFANFLDLGLVQYLHGTAKEQ